MTNLNLFIKQILGLAASVPRVGRLGAPDALFTGHRLLCGSRSTLDFKLDDKEQLVDAAPR